MNEQTKPVCPKCNSTCVVEISNMRHCNQCSANFDLVKDPIAQRAHTREKRWPRNLPCK